MKARATPPCRIRRRACRAEAPVRSCLPAAASIVIPRFTARTTVGPCAHAIGEAMMKAVISNSRAWLVLGVPALFVFASASADPAAADAGASDPSDWKCTLCPFLQGVETTTEAGVQYANGANATFGRYTGIDHSGPYADVSGSGQARSDDGAYLNYESGEIGSRLARRICRGRPRRQLRSARQLRWPADASLRYGSEPFQANGTNLGLPAGWVAAGGRPA